MDLPAELHEGRAEAERGQREQTIERLQAELERIERTRSMRKRATRTPAPSPYRFLLDITRNAVQ